MTIINPNSIAGITSVTAEAGVMNFYKSDGTLAGLQLNGVNFNTTSGISTFNNVYVGGTITYEDVKNVDSVGVVTARAGINLTGGNITLGDSGGNSDDKLVFGADGDLKIFHNGTNNYIDVAAGSGHLYVRPKNNFYIQDYTNGEVWIAGILNGGTYLYHNGNLKAETTADGFQVTDGYLDLNNTSGSGASLRCNSAGTFYAGNAAQGDLAIYVQDNTNNSIILQANTGEKYLEANMGGSVDVYHHGNKKFETTNTGVSITGIPVATQTTGNVGLELHATGSGRGSQTKYHNDHGEAYVGTAGDTTGDFLVHNSSNSHMLFATNNTERLRIDSGGRVGIKNTSPSSQYFNNLVVGDNSSGDWGITIRTNSSNKGVLAFSDSDASDANRYDGYIAYHHNGQSMRFHTGGANERLRITSGGNIGVGTDLSVTSAQLDVWGDGSAYPTLRLGTEEYQTEGEDIRFGRTDIGPTDIRYHSITSFHDASGAANYLKFKVHDGGSSPFQSQSTALTLRGDGKVGIGSEIPAHHLDVVGNARVHNADPALYLQSTANASNICYIRMGDTSSFQRASISYDLNSGFMMWKLGGAGNNVEHMRYDGANNRLHIGKRNGNQNATHWSTARVSIVGPDPIATSVSKAGSYLAIGNNESELNGVYPITFGYTNNSNSHQPAYIAYKTTNSSSAEYGDLLFGTRNVVTDTMPTERLRIDSAGHVSVGVKPSSGLGLFSVKPNSSADAFFKVRPANDFDGSATGSVIDNRNSANNASTDFIIRSKTMRFWMGDGGGEKMRITSDGDVLIGATTWAYPKRLNVRDNSGSTISLSSEDNQTGNANTGPGIEFLLYNGSSTTASAELRAWQESSTSGNASSYLKFLVNPNGSMLEAYKINSRGNVIFGSHSNWFNDDAVTQGEGAWRIQLKGGSGSGGSNPPSEMGYLLIDADGGHNSATMNYGIKCYDTYHNVSGHVCAGYFSTKHKWSSHTKHWGVVGRGVNRGPSSSSGGRGHSGFSSVLAPVGVMGVIENSDTVGGTVSESVAVMAINDATKGGENIGVAIHTKAGANNVYGLMYTHGGSNSPKVYFKPDGGIANYSGNNSNLSDQSQKKDIVDAPSTWNQVKNWKIRNFRMNEDSSSVPLKFGVIAQEIKTVTPNIVSVFQPAKAGIAATTISEPGPNGETGPDWMVNVPEQPEQPELLGVCDQQVDWMVAKALQEAMAKIEVLEAKVAALESS